MTEPPAYSIDDILASNDNTTAAFKDIRGLTERVTQQKMNVSPDSYSGPHYGLDDGLQIVRKYSQIIAEKDTAMGTVRRVESHWQEKYGTISGQGFWAGE